MRMIRALTAVLLFTCLSAAAPANADPVSDWNAITMIYVFGDSSAMVPPGRGGPLGLLDVALVHVAVHDAVQAIEGRFQPYYYSDRTALRFGSPAAAVASAAHRVLVRLYGTRPEVLTSLNARYDAYLAQHGLTGDPGLDVGEAAAVALYDKHYRAPILVPAFFGVASPGQWRSAVPMAALSLAFTQPFTLDRPSQFRPPPPPPLTSEVYRRDYDEVKARGALSAHPNADTDMARFWWTVNYFTRWNETVRQVAASAGLSVGDSARLFALAGLAAADAAIAVWDSKYFYNFWRPSTAIVEGDYDPNHHTEGDTGWKALVTDPPYPDYVSGANGLTAAFTGMLQLFFATDEMLFSVKNPDPSLIIQERHFDRFSDAAAEVVEARILVGIHFRFADEEARRLGNRVAQWTFMHFLRPVPGR